MHSPETTSPVICKNCEAPVQGNFCSNCSQRADTHRFSVAHFGHEFFHAFTHTDKGILLLMKELLYRPGKVALEYNAGKRKKYFNPITFLLIITAIQFFVNKKTEIFSEMHRAMGEWTMQFANIDSAEEKARFDKSNQNAGNHISKVEENSKTFTLLLIPVLSLFSWLFFKKSGQNYAENLVLHVLIIGGTTLIFFVVGVIPFLLVPSQLLTWVGIYFVVNLIYYIVAYKQFFQQGWGITIFKSLVVQVIFMITSQVITFVVVKIF